MVFRLYPAPVTSTEGDTDDLLLSPHSASRVSITLSPPSSHSMAQPQNCQAVGMAACHWHNDSGWDQRKLSHHSDTGPKDKFTFSSLSATGASVPGTPLHSPDLISCSLGNTPGLSGPESCVSNIH